MDPAGVDGDELIEFWTLLEIDREQLIGKRGATALGFALLLKHYSRQGRFPRGRSDLNESAATATAWQRVATCLLAVGARAFARYVTTAKRWVSRLNSSARIRAITAVLRHRTRR